MSAFLEIQKNRKALERIDFANTLRLAMNGSPHDFRASMERWAKDAEISLTFED